MVDPDIASQGSSFKMNSSRSWQATLHRDAVFYLWRKLLQRLIQVASELADTPVVAKEILRSGRCYYSDDLHNAWTRAPDFSFPRFRGVIPGYIEILWAHLGCLIIFNQKPDRVTFRQMFERASNWKQRPLPTRFRVAHQLVWPGMGDCYLFTEMTTVSYRKPRNKNRSDNTADNPGQYCHGFLGYRSSRSVTPPPVVTPLIPSRSPSHKGASTFHPSFTSLQPGPLRRNLLVLRFPLRGGVNNFGGDR
jgi:hypothetical protein